VVNHPAVIDTILGEGLTLLHGKPKAGLSELALNYAYAVASGGQALGVFPAFQGDVLYIDIVSGERRIQEFLHAASPDSDPPERLYFAPTWPLIGAGFEGLLSDYLRSHPYTRLVVVDELNDLLPGPVKLRTITEQLSHLSHKHHIALVLVQTTRIVDRSFFGASSGATGMTAALDMLAELRRSDTQADAGWLRLMGRRLDLQFPLSWDAQRSQWSIDDRL
jgi:hypothetical protein